MFGGSLLGLAASLEAGMVFALRHLAVRLVFRLKGFGPWSYIEFLDCASNLAFLRRVGSGYVFFHDLLMEYFVGGASERFP